MESTWTPGFPSSSGSGAAGSQQDPTAYASNINWQDQVPYQGEWNELPSAYQAQGLDLNSEEEQEHQRLLNKESWRAGYDVLTEGALGDYPEE